jgi:hypothetical protein
VAAAVRALPLGDPIDNSQDGKDCDGDGYDRQLWFDAFSFVF